MWNKKLKIVDFKIDQNPFKHLIKILSKIEFRSFPLYNIERKTLIKKTKLVDFKNWTLIKKPQG